MSSIQDKRWTLATRVMPPVVGGGLGLVSAATLATEDRYVGKTVNCVAKFGKVWAPALRQVGQTVGEGLCSVWPPAVWIYRAPEKLADGAACLVGAFVNKVPWDQLKFVFERAPNTPWPPMCWDGEGIPPPHLPPRCPDPYVAEKAEQYSLVSYAVVYAMAGVLLGHALGRIAYKSPEWIASCPLIPGEVRANIPFCVGDCINAVIHSARHKVERRAEAARRDNNSDVEAPLVPPLPPAAVDAGEIADAQPAEA